MTLSTDTWGISGPTFLLVYGFLIVLVGLAAVHERRRLVGPPAQRPTTDRSADLRARPHDVAHLNGGEELALFSTLGAMHVEGVVTSSRGTLQAVGRLRTGAGDLERAVHAAAASPVHRRQLPRDRAVRAALAGSEQRLVRTGLLLSEDARRRIRYAGAWMLAVCGLGLLRLLAGIADAKPVGFLVLELLVAAVAAAVLMAWVPRRTGAGDRTLAALRSEHHGLAPELKPDWTVHGPADAALGIGIFGVGALWASDPGLAQELEVARASAAGASGGGGGVYSGDGGGSSSGDGGGGGGCGGGGCGG